MVAGNVQADFGIDLKTTIFLFINFNQREKMTYSHEVKIRS